VAHTKARPAARGGVRVKRFHVSEYWNQQWFRELEPNRKLLLLYLIDSVDLAGIFTGDDWGRVSYQIGAKVGPSDVDEINRRFGEPFIVNLGNAKFWLTRFCSEQYGPLTDASAPHRGVFKRLRELGLETQDTIKYRDKKAFERLSEAFPKPFQSLKDKDTIKEKATAQDSSQQIQALNIESRGNGCSGSAFASEPPVFSAYQRGRISHR